MENKKDNRIICGDCLEVFKTIADKSIDLVCTDPPYEFISKDPVGGGIMKKENKKHLKKIKKDFGMSFSPEKLLNECKRVLKAFNGYFFTNKTLLRKYIEFADKNNYSWDLLIWSKTNPIPLNSNHYLLDKEYIVYIKEKGATFNSQLGYENYFTVIERPIGCNNKLGHPTQKPVELIYNAIRISSNENDVVLDPYLGSGTTAVVCKDLNRRCIGIEINPEYVKIAKNRLRQERLFE
jgi:DNA modification methylase